MFVCWGYEAKYHLLIKKDEGAGLKKHNDSKTFRIWMIFVKILNPKYMLSNKKINSVVTELSIRDGKLNTFLAFNT